MGLERGLYLCIQSKRRRKEKTIAFFPFESATGSRSKGKQVKLSYWLV